MSRRLSRSDYNKDYIERADESYATHVITEGSKSASWTIQRADGTIFYRTDILWLKRGFFLIHGDIATVLVWTDRGTAEDRLDWIGNSNPRYIAEKVDMAMKASVALTREKDVAAHDLAAMIAEDRCTAWVNALEQLEKYGDSVIGVMRDVWNETGDSEFDIGEVVDGRVYYAQAAVRCLLRLLKEAKAEATSKEQ